MLHYTGALIVTVRPNALVHFLGPIAQHDDDAVLQVAHAHCTVIQSNPYRAAPPTQYNLDKASAPQEQSNTAGSAAGVVAALAKPPRPT